MLELHYKNGLIFVMCNWLNWVVFNAVNSLSVSTIDELEDFAMGGTQTNASSRKANVKAAETKQNLAARMNNGKRVPAAKVNQANGVDDLESFFSMGSRSSSVPKSRTPTMVNLKCY